MKALRLKERRNATEILVKMVAWLGALRGQSTDDDVRAQFDALIDGVLEDRFQYTNDDVHRHLTTSESSVGPVTIDFDMARSHGWTEGQIRRCYALVTASSRLEYRIASHRQGYTKQCKACECWTIPEYPEKPCHLCHPRLVPPHLGGHRWPSSDG